MDVSVLLTTFGVIFLAELGDKTQLAAMAMAARYPWKKIFLGIAGAFLVLNAAAVLVGSVLFEIVPLRWIQLASGALFLFFAIATLRSRNEEEDDDLQTRGGHGPTVTAFLLILVAELGDKTQLMTASLAAQHASQLSVFAGSTLALWLVSLMGIFVGAQLVRVVPMKYIKIAAGLLFLVFGVVILVQAVRAFGFGA